MTKPCEYRILIEGQLDARWSDWFDGLSVALVGESETAIQGPITDQAALRGILERIWDLNLAIISVQRLPE